MQHESRHHLSLAKITKPRLPKVLERGRLFRILDGGRQYPVIWVTGPAGSGKTTLVVSYVETRGLLCALSRNWSDSKQYILNLSHNFCSLEVLNGEP
jgi:predicted AAA+ superfamily ATPase